MSKRKDRDEDVDAAAASDGASALSLKARKKLKKKKKKDKKPKEEASGPAISIEVPDVAMVVAAAAEAPKPAKKLSLKERKARKLKQRQEEAEAAAAAAAAAAATSASAWTGSSSSSSSWQQAEDQEQEQEEATAAAPATEAATAAPSGKKLSLKDKKAKKLQEKRAAEEAAAKAGGGGGGDGGAASAAAAPSAAPSSTSAAASGDPPVPGKKLSLKDKKAKKLQEKKEADEAAKAAEAGPSSDPTVPDKGVSRCFVGNLPFKIDEDGLREFFRENGAGEIIDDGIFWLTDKESGQFYGSSFVKFETSAGAAIAESLDGSELMGRQIKCMRRAEKVQRRGGAGGSTGFVKANNPLSERPAGCTTVYVGNVPYNMTDEQMTKWCAGCGDIKSIRWMTHQDSGKFKGCGYIEFYTEDAVTEMVKKNGASLMGRPIRVDYADHGKGTSGGW